MSFLKKIFAFVSALLLKFGTFVSRVFLTVFYFTVFALFAIPYRIFLVFKKRNKETFFSNPSHQYSSLEDFKNEY